MKTAPERIQGRQVIGTGSPVFRCFVGSVGLNGDLGVQPLAFVAGLPGYLFGDSSCPSPSRRRSALSKDAVAEALRQTGGNRTRAAKTLGISRVTLWKKIKAMGLEGAGK